MRIATIYKLFPFFLSLFLFVACRGNKEANELAHNHSHHEEHAHNHGHEGHQHNHEGHSHDDGDEDGTHDEEDAITIDPEKARKLGIESAVVGTAPFTEAIKVSGELSAPPSNRTSVIANKTGVITFNTNIRQGEKLSSGQAIGTINGSSVSGGDLSEALRIEYEATLNEYERLKPLYEKGVVSAKVFNEAKNAYDRAKVALGGERGRSNTVISPASGTLLSLSVNNGDFVEAGQTIGIVGQNTTFSFRADLPKRYHHKSAQIVDAFIIPSCGDCAGFKLSDFGGKRSQGSLISAENVSGFYPIYFTFNNNGTLEGNGFIEAYLLLNTDHNALTVPEKSLFEQQGQWFVYVQLDEDCYEKRPVVKGGSNGENVEIISGLKEGESVVTEGVTFVKLAESSGAVPEGHSHTH